MYSTSKSDNSILQIFGCWPASSSSLSPGWLTSPARGLGSGQVWLGALTTQLPTPTSFFSHLDLISLVGLGPGLEELRHGVFYHLGIRKQTAYFSEGSPPWCWARKGLSPRGGTILKSTKFQTKTFTWLKLWQIINIKTLISNSTLTDARAHTWLFTSFRYLLSMLSLTYILTLHKKIELIELIYLLSLISLMN